MARKEVDDREKERRRRERWALLLLLLFQGLEDDLHDAADDFAAGKLTPAQFGDRVYSYLLPAHIQAAYIGRRKAGVSGALHEDEHDAEFGTEAAEHELEFLDKFVQDLADERYNTAEAKQRTGAAEEPLPDGEPPPFSVDVDAIKRRLTLYAMGIAATANEAWTEALPDTTRYTWRDVKDEAECDDCRRNARKGPYTRETLPGIPGDGRTKCKRNCRCEIVTQGRRRSFDLRHLFDGASLIDDEELSE